MFYRDSAIIPLIPLGLKETKDVDFSVPFKVVLFLFYKKIDVCFRRKYGTRMISKLVTQKVCSTI